MRLIGNVVARGVGRFEWIITAFSTLPRTKVDIFDSPDFDVEGERWYLRMYPNGTSGSTRISFTLRRRSSLPEPPSCTVGLKRADHSLETICSETCGDYSGPDFIFYITRRKLENGGWLLDDQLTVTCFFAPRGGTHSIPRDIGTEQSASAIAQDSRRDASKPTEAKSVEKWRSDYKKLLKSETDSDFLVVVSGREFRAHKNILRVRSPVFDAMFEHETEERQSGKVVVEDLNPDAFQDFLEFLYTGRVEDFSEENVYGLYAAADKYDVQELKSVVLEFMQRTLSLESFCDVMALALRHQEQDLMDRAVDFFKNNLYNIIVTVKWQAFMEENATAANELFMKALVPKKAK